MSVDRSKIHSAYGLDQAIETLSTVPIVSRRNPTTRDKAPIGQMWVNRTANTSYVLVDRINNTSVWGLANTPVVGNLNVGGTLTAGTGLVATVGGVVATGNSTITGTLVVSSTITATLGNITATAGNLVSTLGDIRAVNGNIIATAGDIVSTLGDLEATQGNIIATLGNIRAVNGDIVATLGDIVATAGDIIATNGDVVLIAAGSALIMDMGMKILSGAGIPANALAVNIGDIYIRSNAAAAAERIYIATGAGAWTNVSCAA